MLDLIGREGGCGARVLYFNKVIDIQPNINIYIKKYIFGEDCIWIN